jgi:hypothetical protein
MKREHHQWFSAEITGNLDSLHRSEAPCAITPTLTFLNATYKRHYMSLQEHLRSKCDIDTDRLPCTSVNRVAHFFDTINATKPVIIFLLDFL